VPSANNRFPPANVIVNIEERLNEICASINVQIRPILFPIRACKRLFVEGLIWQLSPFRYFVLDLLFG
jgi:hypothetical protein